MTRGLDGAGGRRDDAARDRRFPRYRRCRATQGDEIMQWQTPTAIDHRYGFEISMYSDAR